MAVQNQKSKLLSVGKGEKDLLELFYCCNICSSAVFSCYKLLTLELSKILRKLLLLNCFSFKNNQRFKNNFSS